MIWKWALLFLVVIAGGFLISHFNYAQNEEPERKAGDARTDPFGIEQVWVPAGSFLMGTDTVDSSISIPSWARNELPSEKPQHKVTLTKGYWIDKYEVTNLAFQAFVDDGGYTDQSLWSEKGWQWLTNVARRTAPISCQGRADDKPRACITWYEAEAYANWRGARLPTEAEWEFAARGPESLIYPYGNEFDREKANVLGTPGTVAVGSYAEGVSWVGAHDMSGNVMEWVNDWLDVNYYSLMIEVDPHGPETGTKKVEKGGWWESNSFVARAAYRHFEDGPTYQDHHIGVRLVSDEGSQESDE